MTRGTPAFRRRITIALHWSLFLLLIVIAASSEPLVWAQIGLALAGLGMVGLALVFGLMNGPGPKLDGVLRRLHPWAHRGMYALLGWAALASGAAALDLRLPGPDARMLALVLLGLASLHGVFHLWRHTALGDGALRRMLPRAMHGAL